MKSVLINISFLIEVDDKIIENNCIDIDLLENQIIKTIENLKKYNIKWESSNRIMLNEATLNCGHCHNCNCWCTDKEKPNSISQLCNGAVYDGKLLCDECLPKNHRWAF